MALAFAFVSDSAAFGRLIVSMRGGSVNVGRSRAPARRNASCRAFHGGLLIAMKACVNKNVAQRIEISWENRRRPVASIGVAHRC